MLRLRSRHRFFGNQSGSAAVEMALVAAPFFALVIAILQTGLVYLYDQCLEEATEKAARVVLTGTAQTTGATGMTQAQYQTKVCAVLPALLKCSNVMVDLQTYASFSGAVTAAPTLTFDKTGKVTNTWSYAAGGPGDIVVLRVMYQMPVVGGPLNFLLSNLPNGNRLLMSTAVFKNEPYQ